MSHAASDRDKLLSEIGKCRACRFCMDVCPTYQASEGVESFSSFGRLQIIKYLFSGALELDDALIYSLYSCLQCRRCEIVCKSKGQNLDICELIGLCRCLLSESLILGGNDA